jgi:16S rRNA pseudouridine516 synthase
VEKEYYAKIKGVVTQYDVDLFRVGLTMKNGEEAKPGELTLVSVDKEKGTSEIRLVIHEGKFHQVKRMFQAVSKEVTFLKRLRMGNLGLDENLAPGEYRKLEEKEVALLKHINK